MDELFQTLYDSFKGYITSEETKSRIEKAYLFAKAAHKGQKRASGEEYITHPVAVAKTLCEYYADPETIEAALLHDVIEDTDKTFDDIRKNFSMGVATLVEGLTKIEKHQYTDELNQGMANFEEFANNYQKMLFSMSKDIRVIWIKLSDRLNNMQTLDYLPLEKQIRISNETIKIYAPIAHKLGMNRIKAELEDLSFKYLYPDEYEELTKKIQQTKKQREKDIEKMVSSLSQMMEAEGIKCEISGRIKNFWSIRNKIINKGTSFENIYDLQALRIIVDTVMDCYKAIGIVHSKYTPLPQRIKDYIAMPKPNMYQSLHTTILCDGRPFEIQIRTHEMDEIAEVGIAAHWAYKEGIKLNKNYYIEAASKLRWYSDLQKFTNKKSDNTKEEVTTLFDEDVLNANVYVFTPKNTVISLPEGSTPIDFAYRIHSKIGDKFVGAIVNGKIVPMSYELKTGDICEIKTSQSSMGPNENWLKIAKTASARGKIKQFLNRKNHDLLLEEGRNALKEELKNQRLDINITDGLVKQKFPKDKGINTLEDLYIAIGKKVVSAQAFVQTLKNDNLTDEEKLIALINTRNKNQIYHDDIDIIVEGLSTPSVKLSKCCEPIPGDEIIGFVTKGVGIAVHRKNCKNCKSFDQNRLINVYWAKSGDKRFPVGLKINVFNRDNVLADILNTAIACNAKVDKVTARITNREEGVITLTIGVYNKENLDILISNLEKIKGVYQIMRASR